MEDHDARRPLLRRLELRNLVLQVVEGVAQVIATLSLRVIVLATAEGRRVLSVVVAARRSGAGDGALLRVRGVGTDQRADVASKLVHFLNMNKSVVGELCGGSVGLYVSKVCFIWLPLGLLD